MPRMFAWCTPRCTPRISPGSTGRLCQVVTWNLEALVERWGKGLDKGVTEADVGRLALFADNLRLDVDNLSRYVQSVHKALDEAIQEARETQAREKQAVPA
jgi:hypothetical protein